MTSFVPIHPQKKPSKFKKIAIVIVPLILIGLCAAFFSMRNNAAVVIDNSKKVESGEDSDGITEEFEVPVQKKEFKEFGSFWMEINTDDLEIKAPVLPGVDKGALKRGIGRHETTAIPNPESGNIVLSGHRWIPGSNPAHTVFRHLDKLSIGDDISLFHDGKEYVYRVRESKTVSANATEILEETEEPQLTIYTCTPVFTALRRLVYVADLISVN